MVVGAFPLAKLGTLLLRQASKPIANWAKERAKTHPFFSRYVCMPPAQFYNWCEVKMKMYILNMGKPVEIPKLNDNMAIELGANLLGETIIFTIASGIIFMEYSRQVRKDAAKEEMKRAEMDSIAEVLKELYIQTKAQEVEIKQLTRVVYDLESRTIKKPFVKSQPIDSNNNENKGPNDDLNPAGIVNTALDQITNKSKSGE